MEIKTVKVSDKGQIAIPISIREKIGIDKGDELILFEIEGKILIEKVNKISKFFKEVWDNKEDDIWSSYLRK